MFHHKIKLSLVTKTIYLVLQNKSKQMPPPWCCLHFTQTVYSLLPPSWCCLHFTQTVYSLLPPPWCCLHFTQTVYSLLPPSWCCLHFTQTMHSLLTLWIPSEWSTRWQWVIIRMVNKMTVGDHQNGQQDDSGWSSEWSTRWRWMTIRMVNKMTVDDQQKKKKNPPCYNRSTIRSHHCK